jgi:hypothetical protein
MRIAIITPSFANDFALCKDLHRSVLRHAPASAEHHIIVPKADLELFSRLGDSRTCIRCEADFLPASFLRVPFSKYTLDLHRPFPPVRGWILQQLVKLSATAQCEADVAVLIDSDVEFVKPFSVETFMRDGIVRFYREPGGVNARLPRHILWHKVARALLGLPNADPPFTNYISSLIAWNPAIVRRMLAHIERTMRRPWASAVAGQLHFSEWTLYGLYVDHVAGAPANTFVSDDPLCHAYWDPTPLDGNSGRKFVAGVRPSDIAAMISAKSQTTQAVRDTVFGELRRKH